MDYKGLKAELKEMADIAAAVPEPFREKCFEILLRHFLEHAAPSKTAEPKSPQDKPVDRELEKFVGTKIPVKAHLRAFMQRTGVTLEQLQQLVILEGEEVHFIHEPAHQKVTRGQMEWALLLSLKQALMSNEFSTDPEDVRSICQEKGFYDKGNFAATFRRPPGDAYFKQPLQPQGPRQTLSNDGQTALAELIRTLTQKSE
jgi:hypothetical protein